MAKAVSGKEKEEARQLGRDAHYDIPKKVCVMIMLRKYLYR